MPLYPGLIICNIVFCVITSVAILKYKLLGIQIIFRRGLSYVLASIIAATPYLLVVLFFENKVLRAAVPTWIWVFLLIVLALFLQPLWRLIQSFVDRSFNMSRYDFLKGLEEFSLKYHRLDDINTFGHSLVKLIEETLQSSNVHLFLTSGSREFKLIASAKDGPPAVNLFNHNPVLIWLNSHKVLLRREELAYISRFQSLTGRNWMR